MSEIQKKSSVSAYEFDIKLKFVILGESMVGKTSIINRYINNKFGDRYLCTVGIDFQEKIVNKKNKRVKLQIWDTAGEERYRNLTKNYFQQCNGIIITYDISDNNSFEQIKFWINQIAEMPDQKVSCILVGNKCDLTTERMVEQEKGSKLAKKLGYKFFETSAKLNLNIDEAFDGLIDEVLLNYKQPVRDSMKLSSVQQSKKEKKKCC